jgi:hypothetical protein
MQFDRPNNSQNQARQLLNLSNRGTESAQNGVPGLEGKHTALAAAKPFASQQPTKPWALPRRGMAFFYGPGNTPRLSHYFLPRLLLGGKRVLLLDGANVADPRLLARLARERSVPFEEFNRQVEIARAFTCFQLTELIARVPRFLKSFPAEVLIVTALPELYFDEDVRDWDARVAFEQAFENLQRWITRPLSVAIFSASKTFMPTAARKNFFARVQAAAAEVWHCSLGEDGRPRLVCERSSKFLSEVNHGSNHRNLPRTG